MLAGGRLSPLSERQDNLSPPLGSVVGVKAANLPLQEASGVHLVETDHPGKRLACYARCSQRPASRCGMTALHITAPTTPGRLLLHRDHEPAVARIVATAPVEPFVSAQFHAALNSPEEQRNHG